MNAMSLLDCTSLAERSIACPNKAPYSFSACRVSCPSLSKSAESRIGLMALASSGGYSVDRCSFSPPLGMMIDALGWREASLGRPRRGLPGCSFSDSEAEATDEVGDVAPAEMARLG